MATFGYTSIGGTNATTTLLRSNEFTAPDNGTITRMYSYTRSSTGSISIGHAVYASNGTNPTDLLGEDSGNATATTTATWYGTDINVDITDTSEYFLASWGSTTRYYYYDSGGNHKRPASATWETWPDPFGTPSSQSLTQSTYAEYTIDGTFGYSTVGGSFSGSAHDMRGNTHSAPVNGNVTSLHGYLEIESTESAKLAIYQTSDDSLLAGTGEFTTVATGWVSDTVDVDVTSGTNYDLIFYTGAVVARCAFDSGLVSDGYLDLYSSGYPTLPDPATPTRTGSGLYSIYATFTEDTSLSINVNDSVSITESTTFVSSSTTTFGYSAQGASSQSLASTEGWTGVQTVTPSDFSSLVSVTVWCFEAFIGFMKGGITDSSRNFVTNGVGDSTDIGVGSAQSNVEQVLNYTTLPTLSPDTTYYLGTIHDGTGGVYYDTDTGVTSYEDSTNNFASPTNPTDASSGNKKYSFYATYSSTPTTLTVDLNDAVALSEDISITNTQLGGIDVFESVAVTELIQAGGAHVNIDVFDAVSASEDVNAVGGGVAISVNDSITLLEDVSASFPQPPLEVSNVGVIKGYGVRII